MASGGVGAGGGWSHPDQARLLWLRRQLVTGVDCDKVGQGQARWDLDRHQLGNYQYLSGGLRENLEASLQQSRASSVVPFRFERFSFLPSFRRNEQCI